jgi:hypothetical protein
MTSAVDTDLPDVPMWRIHALRILYLLIVGVMARSACAAVHSGNQISPRDASASPSGDHLETGRAGFRHLPGVAGWPHGSRTRAAFTPATSES